ncbi:aldo/keto reductase [Kitasatospora sp. NPDC057692]|uniref:aldo/keto reductase n=1 Tax=Kitasatospora sp. NPDC057692 TaxID=3346215 RepID=UPI0036AB776B
MADCEATGIAYVPYFPLGGGLVPLDLERLGRVAARGERETTSQVALGALLAESPSVLAIPGTGSLDHLEENLAAGALVLGAEDLAEARLSRGTAAPRAAVPRQLPADPGQSTTKVKAVARFAYWATCEPLPAKSPWIAIHC